LILETSNKIIEDLTLHMGENKSLPCRAYEPTLAYTQNVVLYLRGFSSATVRKQQN